MTVTLVLLLALVVITVIMIALALLADHDEPADPEGPYLPSHARWTTEGETTRLDQGKVARAIAQVRPSPAGLVRETGGEDEFQFLPHAGDR